MESLAADLLVNGDVEGAIGMFQALALKQASTPRDRREKLKFARLARHCAVLAAWHDRLPSATMPASPSATSPGSPSGNFSSTLTDTAAVCDMLLNPFLPDRAVFFPKEQRPDASKLTKTYQRFMLCIHPDKHPEVANASEACAALTARRDRFLESLSKDEPVPSETAPPPAREEAPPPPTTTTRSHTRSSPAPSSPSHRARSRTTASNNGVPPPHGASPSASLPCTYPGSPASPVRAERLPVLQMKRQLQEKQLDRLLGSLRESASSPIALHCDLSHDACGPTIPHPPPAADDSFDGCPSPSSSFTRRSATVVTATQEGNRAWVTPPQDLLARTVSAVLEASLRLDGETSLPAFSFAPPSVPASGDEALRDMVSSLRSSAHASLSSCLKSPASSGIPPTTPTQVVVSRVAACTVTVKPALPGLASAAAAR